MRTLHGIFDINNDGVISFDDFRLLAQNFGDLGHLTNEEMEDFHRVMRVSNFVREKCCFTIVLIQYKINF